MPMVGLECRVEKQHNHEITTYLRAWVTFSPQIHHHQIYDITPDWHYPRL
jgi:hypothetical protein